MNQAAQEPRVRRGGPAAPRRGRHRADGVPTDVRPHHARGGRGSARFAPLRWLRRKLSRLMRRVASRLRAPLRPLARLLLVRWVANHLPERLRWLGRVFGPASEPGFGFWWLVATLGVAVVLGMVVALLLTPVAGLIALLVVAIWALVRRHRDKQRDDGGRAPARVGPSPGA